MTRYENVKIPKDARLTVPQIKKIAVDRKLYIWELIVNAIEEYAARHAPTNSVAVSLPNLEETNHQCNSISK